jgi:hypothetical protein
MQASWRSHDSTYMTDGLPSMSTLQPVHVKTCGGMAEHLHQQC